MLGENIKMPALTVLYNNDHILFLEDKPIMVDSSENCYMHIAKDSDGNRLKRGALTQKILKKLSRPQYKTQEDYNAQWEKIWNDPLCLNYKRKDHEDYWLWNYQFYNAPMWDLQYIYRLIEK